jgi:hypothetical protein
MTGGDKPARGGPANAQAEEAESDKIRIRACLAADLW